MVIRRSASGLHQKRLHQKRLWAEKLLPSRKAESEQGAAEHGHRRGFGGRSDLSLHCGITLRGSGIGAARTVVVTCLSKIVEPKLPVITLCVFGPSVSEPAVAVDQVIWIVALLLETEPPDEVPINSPVAPSVMSVTTISRTDEL